MKKRVVNRGREGREAIGKVGKEKGTGRREWKERDGSTCIFIQWPRVPG